MKAPVKCVACSVFRDELEALADDLDLDTTYLSSMLHLHPESLRDTLEQRLDAPGVPTVIVYGDCHPQMDTQAAAAGRARVQGTNCAQMLLGPQRYRRLMHDGAFFLLPEWAHRWRRIFQHELGLDQAIARELMGDLHRYLCYLDTGLRAVPSAELQAASDWLALPWRVEQVNLELFHSRVRDAAQRQREG